MKRKREFKKAYKSLLKIDIKKLKHAQVLKIKLAHKLNTIHRCF